MRRVLAVVALVATVALAVVGVQPASAQSAPSFTVTPSSGLRYGDEVTIEINGVTGLVAIGICPPSATSVFDCWRFDVITVPAGPTSTVPFVPARLQVDRFGPPGSPPIDCASTACAIGVTSLGGPFLLQPIDFVDEPLAPPVFALDPTPLVDGSVALGDATGFQPYEAATVSQCLPGATSASECVVDPVAAASSLEDGAMRFGTRVHRILRVPGAPDPVADCGVEACTLSFTSLAGTHHVPLSFADPDLQVTIEPLALLDLATDEADVRVSVTCAIATPYSLRVTIGQGATSRTATIAGRRCNPATPSTSTAAAYATAGGGPYAVGTIDVSVEASPAAALLPGDPGSSLTTETGTADLADSAPIVATIGALIADPANAELRAQVVRAIIDRISYDPVFAAAWAALLES